MKRIANKLKELKEQLDLLEVLNNKIDIYYKDKPASDWFNDEIYAYCEEDHSILHDGINILEEALEILSNDINTNLTVKEIRKYIKKYGDI